MKTIATLVREAKEIELAKILTPEQKKVALDDIKAQIAEVTSQGKLDLSGQEPPAPPKTGKGA